MHFISGRAAALLAACATIGLASPPPIPVTFGNGLAGFSICQAPTVVLNYNLSAGSSYGLLSHFWTTGGSGIDTVVVE